MAKTYADMEEYVNDTLSCLIHYFKISEADLILGEELFWDIITTKWHAERHDDEPIDPPCDAALHWKEVFYRDKKQE